MPTKVKSRKLEVVGKKLKTINKKKTVKDKKSEIVQDKPEVAQDKPKTKAETGPLVVLGIPSGDMVHANFATALASMVATSMAHGASTITLNEQGPVIEHNYNKIVKTALELKIPSGQKASHILFLDTDTFFPAHTLLQLLSWKADIVGCNMVKRDASGDTIERANIEVLGKREGLTRVNSISAGILLVRREVFEAISFPWFHTEYRDDGNILNEDQNFCEKAIRAGFHIFCDEKLSELIGHSGKVIWRLEHLKKSAVELVK